MTHKDFAGGSAKDSCGVIVLEPIGFASQKFLQTALRWDALKKEAYAAYYGVNHFSYYLLGKPFLLETDHRNLLWTEKSDVPIVFLWRVFCTLPTIFCDVYSSCLWNKVYCSRLAVAYACVFEFRAGAMYDV